MKNSFAIDNKENLYSWGSHDSGLLGRQDEVDSLFPKKVEIRDGHDTYKCEMVSSSHFHVAVVANRVNSYSLANSDTKFAYKIFDNLQEWYRNTFVKKLSSIDSLIKLLIMYDDESHELIKYEFFERNILRSFFAYQMFHKKDFYNMKGAYKECFLALLGISPTKMFFQIEDLLETITKVTSPEIREFYNYLLNLYNYFRDHPEDFNYFLNLILGFEKEVSEEYIFYLFQYQNYKKLAVERDEDSKLISRIFHELKSSDSKVNTNLLIEHILKKPTGTGMVFTWGSDSECRLGYKNSKENKDGESEVFIQKIPKLVKFLNPFTKITKISCGYSHTLALSDLGQVFSWGSCKFGCLGNSHSEDLVYPEPILIDNEKKPFKDITEISAGMYFSLAMGKDKSVYSWGCGTSGRLGHGDENSVSLPKLLNFFKNNDIKVLKISAGDTHCAAITSSKDIYTWGTGSYGKLGHGENEDVKLPMFVEFFRNKKLESVICGSNNTLATTTDNRLYCWGKNTNGMLGVFNSSSSNIYIPLEIIFQNEDNNILINNIALGTMHSMFLAADGSLYTCGRNINGILGLNEYQESVPFHLKISTMSFYKTLNDDIRVKPLFENYTQEFTINSSKTKFPTGLIYATCSYSNTAFITNNNQLYMSGGSNLICESKGYKQKKENNYKKEKYKVVPIKIRHVSLAGKVTFIAIGSNHVLCVADKKAFSWGLNICGVLGLSGVSLNEKISEPTKIEKISSPIKMVSVSDSHSLILTTTGEVYSCGSNLYGKLGIGDIKFNETLSGEVEILNELEPVIVKGITIAEYIACSNHHSACIMKYSNNSGAAYSIYTWGGGYAGKLGHNNTRDCNLPKKIDFLEKKSGDEEDEPVYFMQLALGNEFSLALDTQGYMYGWGKTKYLGMNVKDDGIYYTPKIIHKDYKFKYVSCSSSYTLALDKNGIIYGWGKSISINDKTDFGTIQIINCEKAELVSCGVNHFAVIDNLMYTPFTWGNNLNFKCAQTFAKPGDSENSFVQPNPKKIQYFYDKFLDNITTIQKESRLNPEADKNAEKSQSKVGKYSMKNELQLNLLEEQPELKNLGILLEDHKINKKFYEALKEYFDTIKTIEEIKSKKQIEAENTIISLINKTSCKKNDDFLSEIPKVISKNFQLYEAFLTILYNHPCLFLKAKRVLTNKTTYLDLVKCSLGGSGINLRNKRILNTITGLWNSTFKEESSDDNPNNLRDTDHFEEFITFDLYDMIFSLDKDNENVLYDLISELFILFIHEILKNSKDFVDPNKDKDILLLYRDLGDLRKELYIKAVTLITKFIKMLFSDFKDKSRNNLSMTVLWILKRISKLYPLKNKNQYQINLENHCKIFNYFLFVPFVEFLRRIRDSISEKACDESRIISRRIPEILEKAKKKGEYNELYNLYQSHSSVIENNYFIDICSSKSSVLGFLYDIFVSLSKYEKFEFTVKMVKEMNEMCSSNLRLYKNDFTLSTFRDFIMWNSESGNANVPISIKIKDLISIQKTFSMIDFEKEENSNENQKIFKVILSELANFNKTLELENSSTISNFVVNFYIKSNLFFYHTESVNVVKCKNCLLPIHSIFFKNKYVEDYINCRDWKCSYCKSSNGKGNLVCNYCKKLISKKVISEIDTFFKKFLIPKDDELTLLYEDILFYLPVLNQSDDILLEISKERDRLKNRFESKSTEKSEKFEAFMDAFDKVIGNVEDSSKLQNLKNLKIKELNDNAKKNYEKRKTHVKYLNTLKELINFIFSNAENAKSNLILLENQTNALIKSIKRGYSNSFSKDKIPSYLQKYLEENTKEKKNTLKRFTCRELISKKIIDEILFNNQKQESLLKKSYFTFEKDERGYVIKLNYRDTSSKYFICGNSTNEYIIHQELVSYNQILEFRKNARHNPTWNSKEVRFNVFYLIKLFNQLETEK